MFIMFGKGIDLLKGERRAVYGSRGFCFFNSFGSILIEAVVMIGLIAALTPVLYTHISDRKEEIENINKANTFLTLQKAAEDFLQDRELRSSLDFTDGPIVVSPSFISERVSSSLDDGYEIGFRQRFDASGSEQIDAVIVEKTSGGSDIRAAKVASLIGVNAGIKSIMDSENAYGVNGLWKENLSNYGLSGVPDGSTVVTTEYKEQKHTFYTSDMFSDSNLDMGDYSLKANKVVVNRICIGGDDEEHCKGDWSEIGDGSNSDLVLIKKCYEDLDKGSLSSEYCTLALAKGLLRDCSTIATAYTSAGYEADPGYYYLGSSLTKKVCYFIDGALPTSASQIINACNDSGNINRKYACMYDFQTGSNNAGGSYEGKKYTGSCSSIAAADDSLETGYYTITSDYSETGYFDGRGTPCVFAEGKAANDPKEVVTQCSDSTTENHAACARGKIDGLNGSCEQIKAAGLTESRFYKFTTNAILDTSNYSKYNVSTVDRACYFVGGSLASSSQAVTACNSDKSGSVSCGYAWQNGWNTSCSNILSVSHSYASSDNTIMTSLTSGTNNNTCNVTSCSATSGYCSYNKSSQNKPYCKDGECGSICDDDSDCSAYGNSKPYCIGGVCKSCASSGEEVSSGTKCCSGLYRTSSGTCGSCGNYSYDGSRNCYTSCSVGTTHCASGYYCSGSSCVSSCGTVSETGFPIGYLSNRNCCASTMPAVESDTCYVCTGSGQSACSSGYVCMNYACNTDLPAVCSGTTDVDNDTWLDNWNECTICGSNQFQPYESYYDSGSACGYPTSIGSCLDIPSVGGSSYTPRAESKAYGGGKYYYSQGIAYNQPIRHHQINISCNGVTENWRVIGPYVTWWEASEICGRLGKYVPIDRSILTNTDSCGGTARWSLLKSAAPSSLGISSYPTYVWTREDYDNTCGALLVGLNSGDNGYSPRTGAYYDTFVLCGPVSGSETNVKPSVCTTTSSIPNSDWLGNAVKSGCGSSQVQARGKNISGYSCSYPYVSSTTCYSIPSSGSSRSWSGRGTVSHKTATITCNGRRETWHLIGGYVSWWEAVEICERLGLHMPPTTTSLTSTSSSTGCNGSARYSLLVAMAVPDIRY